MTPKVIEEAVDAQVVTITGTFTNVVTGTTRQERQWASATLACRDGEVHAEVFPLTYSTYAHLVFNGANVTVRGMVDRRDQLVLRVDRIASAGKTITPTDQLIEELTTARRRRGTSQQFVADRIGVSQQVLSSWESRISRPTRVNLAAWAVALDREPPPYRPAKYATCGSPTGRNVHTRRNEEACDPCLDSAAEYMRTYRAERRNRSVAA